ncbi:MAG: TerB family tellurite resistance protein [Bacteroidota bacterium]
MAKFGKWIGATLGWATGGPIGALIGFAIGSVFDNAEVTVQHGAGGTGSRQTTAADFSAALLVLSAAIMKADGKVLRSELDYVKRFFAQQFGERHAQEQMLMLRELVKKDIPLQEVCHQIRQHMNLSVRLQLLHYLFGIAKADGHVHKQEAQMIEQIAGFMHISSADFHSIRAMYFRDTHSDYEILEITPQATDEEVKKAYRKMAVKFHPDKVSSLGEEIQKAAKEKFQKVQEAYENIKKERGMA